MLELYQVKLPDACFGIEVEFNQVITAAPTGKWMIGKNFMYICEWVEKKHGTVK